MNEDLVTSLERHRDQLARTIARAVVDGQQPNLLDVAAFTIADESAGMAALR